MNNFMKTEIARFGDVAFEVKALLVCVRDMINMETSEIKDVAERDRAMQKLVISHGIGEIRGSGFDTAWSHGKIRVCGLDLESVPVALVDILPAKMHDAMYAAVEKKNLFTVEDEQGLSFTGTWPEESSPAGLEGNELTRRSSNGGDTKGQAGHGSES